MRNARSNAILPSSGRSRAVPTYQPKRICAIPQCATVLSIYNGADCCCAHESLGGRPGAVFRR